MAETVRDLTLGDNEYRVSNVRGILNPGKFEGEMPHAVRDYGQTPDATHSLAGHVVYRVGHRHYQEESQGFVTEISAEDYRWAIVEDGIHLEEEANGNRRWRYYGKPVNDALEAARLAADDLVDDGSDPRHDVAWCRVSSDMPRDGYEVMSAEQINAAIAETI